MKLVVGLGNPGPEYVGTRHNAGFAVARALADRWSVALRPSEHQGDFGLARVNGRDVGLLLPATFMNASGMSVRSVVDAHDPVPPGDILVVYDDLDLPFGRLRLRPVGGSGGHRGMASIASELGSEDFPRLRFGIGRPQDGQDVIEYVLAPFSDDEARRLDAAVERAADAVEAMIFGDPARAMEEFNRSETHDLAD